MINELKFYPETTHHEIDWTKIKTLGDVKCFLKGLQFVIHDDGSDRWADLRRFYAEPSGDEDSQKS